MPEQPAGVTRPRPPWPLLCLLAASLAWAYWPTLTKLWEKWGSDHHYSHGYLVPPFSLFLLWRGRVRWPGWSDSLCAGGAWLVLLGAAVRLAGTWVFNDWLQAVSLLICLAGAVVLVGGWAALRVAGWPIAFLVFMVPLPHGFEELSTRWLQEWTTGVSTAALRLTGRTAVSEGTVLRVGELRVEVVEACSGLGTLMVFLAMSVAVALVVERPLLDRLVLVVSALPIALLCNALRVVATVLLQEATNRPEMGQTYHDAAGWVMMLLALAILRGELWLLDRLFSAPTGEAAA